MNTCFGVYFANQFRIIDMRQPGFLVEAACVVSHGDWKSSVKPLARGESAMVIGVMDNLYGRWIQVRCGDGRRLDVEARKLNVVDAATLNQDR